ncbi:HAD domain-containing protein [Pseudomonas sp. PS02290]|uniref:HAD domain-containing protein n=1 Tax=Pseudomonas sp. PS02290 TaxID=2991430 RepID=UPI00249AD338|nr:HAD domain-containing protein [Pseudomonas sp. PS02290]
MIIFLDFDGVLHPDSVFMAPSGPSLREEGTLFMWMPLLESVLAQYADARIVLSTSWVRNLGFSRAKKRLSKNLQDRVVGSTWHSSMAKEWTDQILWDQSTRYHQIIRYVVRGNISKWLAIDDDAEGWGAQYQELLIRTDPATGLSGAGVIAELTAKLNIATEAKLTLPPLGD